MDQDRSSMHTNMQFEFGRKSGVGFRVWTGIALVIIGGGLLLDAFDIFDFGGLLGTYWPSLLMLIAIVQLANRSEGWVGSTILFAIGAVLQASKFGWIPGGFWSAFWPILLVILGLSMLIGRRKKKGPSIFNGTTSGTENSDTFLKHTAFFGGSEIRSHTRDLQGGELTAVFGGLEIDLRNADIRDNAVIDVTSIFGGVEIRVPPHWRVISTGTPIFGGLENKTINLADANVIGPMLTLNCTIVFGGVEIGH